MNLWVILILGAIVAFGAWQRAQAFNFLKSAPPGELDNRKQLGKSLGELIDFLSRQEQFAWAGRLGEVRSDLLRPATEPAALARLSDMFGGMGSLNDVTCAEPALDQELDRLLNTVFRDMKLYHGGPADRRQWAELEKQHKDEPPPRIKHAFRGPAPGESA